MNKLLKDLKFTSYRTLVFGEAGQLYLVWSVQNDLLIYDAIGSNTKQSWQGYPAAHRMAQFWYNEKMKG